MSVDSLVNDAIIILKRYRQWAENNKNRSLKSLIDVGLHQVHEVSQGRLLLDEDDPLFKINCLVVSTVYLYYRSVHYSTAWSETWSKIVHRATQVEAVASHGIDSSRPKESAANSGALNEITTLGDLFMTGTQSGIIDLEQLRTWAKTDHVLVDIEPYLDVVSHYQTLKNSFQKAIVLKKSAVSVVVPQQEKQKDLFFNGLQALQDQVLMEFAVHHPSFSIAYCTKLIDAVCPLAADVSAGLVNEVDVEQFKEQTHAYRVGTCLEHLFNIIIGAMVGFVAGVLSGALVAGPVGAVVGAAGGAMVGGIVGKGYGFFKQPLRKPLAEMETAAKKLAPSTSWITLDTVAATCAGLSWIGYGMGAGLWTGANAMPYNDNFSSSPYSY